MLNRYRLRVRRSRGDRPDSKLDRAGMCCRHVPSPFPSPSTQHQVFLFFIQRRTQTHTHDRGISRARKSHRLLPHILPCLVWWSARHALIAFLREQGCRSSYRRRHTTITVQHLCSCTVPVLAVPVLRYVAYCRPLRGQ